MSRTLTASDRKRLIRLASSLPVGSPERKAILAGLSSMQGMLEEEGMMDKMSRKPWGSLGISPTDNQPWGSRDSQSKDYRELYNEAYYDAVTSKKARKALAKRVATLHRKGKSARSASRTSSQRSAALPSATVEMFLRVAVSKLTQYDKRLQKRQPNIYRLGHYLGAIEKVEKDVAPYMRDDSPEALEALRKSLLKRFTSSFSGVSDLAPIRATIKQIDEHLSEGLMPTLTRRSRKAYRDNEETRKMLEKFIGHTVDKWEKATSTLYLNDLSKAYNQIDDFEYIANGAEDRLGEIHVSHMDGSDYADFYDDLMSEIESLREAYESAQHDLQQMVDDGMADPGMEDAVMEKMEDEVLPALEDAIAEFKRSSRVPRK